MKKRIPARTLMFPLTAAVLLMIIIWAVSISVKASGITVLGGTDYSAVYDFDYYISHNPDLAPFYGSDPAGALAHFVSFGMSEGRQACEYFNVMIYHDRYPDLVYVFGDNLQLYYLHYIQCGYLEGRSASGEKQTACQKTDDGSSDTSVSDTTTGTRFTVILDAGHGGRDPGAVRNGVYEKNLNFLIVMKIKTQLEAQGVNVLLTRDDDSFVSLEYRYTFENIHPEAVFVSIHCNALSGTSSIKGMNAYCFAPGNENSSLLAACVYSGALFETGARDRGIRSDSDYKVVLFSTIPSVLMEVGYMSTPSEFSLLCSEDYQERIAEGITNGLMTYYLYTAGSTK